MTNMFPDKGTLYIEQGAGSNAAKLRGFPGSVNAIVDAASISDTDIAVPNPGFGNPIIQTAGSNFVQVNIPVRLFIGPSCSGGSSSLQTVRKWFDSVRMSASGKPVAYSLSNAAYNVYLTGFSVGGADPANDIISLSISGIAPPTIKNALS